MSQQHPIIVLSSPTPVINEIRQVIQLFQAGLARFHLRKPSFSASASQAWIAQIPKKYWTRIMLHQHHHLAEELGLGGVHLTEYSRAGKEVSQLIEHYQSKKTPLSAAIHDLNDLELLGQHCDYVLISPVFDSISKTTYKANASLDISAWKGKTRAKLIALGGMTDKTLPIALKRGFDGVAVLGHIWQQPEKAAQQFHLLQQAAFRPYVLSIAGFDPSAGAGLLADIKTFEQQQVYGLSVCTALTIQNDIHFKAVHWTKEADILAQIHILKERFDIKAVKIGLIENWAILQSIIQAFQDKVIVFDPILRASAGFDFHSNKAFQELIAVLKNINLITPNREEIIQLVPNKTPTEAASLLSQYCPTLLKGGHHEERLGEDELWVNGEQLALFKAGKIALRGKHGSGCVLSSAIAARLAKGEDIVTACREGKAYIEDFLGSNGTLLGYHRGFEF